MADGFQTGVNLGGWISQYRALDEAHFASFVTEADIQRIAGWGMDHVRLPVDYPVLESDEDPGVYREEGFRHIDDCLTWCRRAGLGVVLDLHRAPGYSFGTLETNTLFTSDAAQERFLGLWRTLAARYRGWDAPLWLELLNEMVDRDSTRWNALAHRAIAAIRDIDATRTIVYGGNHYNAVEELPHIALVPNDPHIVYTFHFYQPHLFTHQHASWSKISRDYDRDVEYPGGLPDYEAFLRDHPEYGEWTGEAPYFDRAYLAARLEPAVAFQQRTHLPLYCGEYGVIDVAPAASRLRWHRDVVDLLRDLGIGRAVWSYKGMSFGLVTSSGAVASQELVDIVSRR
jgi:endoglucanase